MEGEACAGVRQIGEGEAGIALREENRDLVFVDAEEEQRAIGRARLRGGGVY